MSLISFTFFPPFRIGYRITRIHFWERVDVREALIKLAFFKQRLSHSPTHIQQEFKPCHSEITEKQATLISKYFGNVKISHLSGFG